MNPKTIISTAFAILFLALVNYFILDKKDQDHHEHNHHEHSHHDEHYNEPAEKGGHGHHHEAPHGGTLVVLGDEFAHLELLLDEQSGLLQAYVLDGMAVMGTRLQIPFFMLDVKIEENKLNLKLMAQTNPLSGEKVGDSSLFSIISKDLIGVKKFNAHIPSINIKGITFKDVSFRFPEGNE